MAPGVSLVALIPALAERSAHQASARLRVASRQGVSEDRPSGAKSVEDALTESVGAPSEFVITRFPDVTQKLHEVCGFVARGSLARSKRSPQAQGSSVGNHQQDALGCQDLVELKVGLACWRGQQMTAPRGCTSPERAHAHAERDRTGTAAGVPTVLRGFSDENCKWVQGRLTKLLDDSFGCG